LGRFAEAIPEAKALAKTPYAGYAPEVLPTCATILAGAGQLDEGIAVMRRFLEFVRDAPAEWQLYGLMLRQNGKTAEAESADRNATIAARNQMHAYHRMALLSLRKGERAEAISLLRELLRRYPDYKPAAETLARLE
jgi:tetratricopeptide (TPR) repeat protein